MQNVWLDEIAHYLAALPNDSPKFKRTLTYVAGTVKRPPGVGGKLSTYIGLDSRFELSSELITLREIEKTRTQSDFVFLNNLETSNICLKDLKRPTILAVDMERLNNPQGTISIIQIKSKSRGILIFDILSSPALLADRNLFCAHI